MPGCPPASCPTTHIASTPSRSAVIAYLTPGTLCMIFTPAACSGATIALGLLPDVSTTGIFSSMVICTHSSIGCARTEANRLMFSPIGLSVRSLALRMSALSSSMVG